MPGAQARLYVNVGGEMGVAKGGVVDLRERHLFVDVATEHANAILSKLSRITVKGNKIKVKVV